MREHRIHFYAERNDECIDLSVDYVSTSVIDALEQFATSGIVHKRVFKVEEIVIKFPTKELILIAASDSGNGIGYQGNILWKLSDDFLRFKKLTLGHPMIMGRKTFDSLPEVLPGRIHIVITRDPLTPSLRQHERIRYVGSIDEAITLGYQLNPKVFIIGGGEIYSQTIGLATRIELTKLDEAYSNDTVFPTIDSKEFELVNVESHKADKFNSDDFSFLTYRRK